MKSGNKKTHKASKPASAHRRRKYTDPSRQYHNWVKGLDLEKNYFGRLFLFFDEHLNIRRFLLLFGFSLVLSIVVFYQIDFSYDVTVGAVADRDIKSPISLEIVNQQATDEKRKEEERSVPLVFDWNPGGADKLIENVSSSFAKLREMYKSTDWSKSSFEKEEQIKTFAQTNKVLFEKELDQTISDREMEWLAELGFSVRIENILVRAFEAWNDQNPYVVETKSRSLTPDSVTPVVSIVHLENRKERSIEHSRIVEITDEKIFSLKGLRGAGKLSRSQKRRLFKLAKKLMVPSLTLNTKATEARKENARESVLPVQVSIKKKQTIVSAGTVVQPVHVQILSEIEELQSETRKNFISIIAAILFVVAILVFFSYLRRFTHNKVKVTTKDITVMGVVTVFVVLLTKLFLFTTDAAFLSQSKAIPPSLFMFLAPVAAGPMLVGLLITSGEVVWLFTIFLAAVLGIMVDMNFSFLIATIIGGIAAARGVFGCTKRNDIYIAGLRTGAVNFVVIFLLMFLSAPTKSDVFHQILWNAPAGFFAGVLASLVAMMLIPLLETVFNYTTDVKLLELANLNNPLMRELMMKAPGTYHHSMAVSTMVEAAATEIGANALLGKVMAMYHDIGKMEHAQYFVENQKGYNPHDHISPYMSKTILIAHVKDGAEMGLEHKLGEPIIDGILQHHGTTLINYFYNRALEETDENVGPVDEMDFRYPGPKPQFKEAALVMLADAIEATARSLDEPTPVRLQNIVKNIIQSKFIDGQLDECNLTLRDLSIIEKSFKGLLLSIYHQRMDYPHMKDGKVITVPKTKGKNDPKGPHTA